MATNMATPTNTARAQALVTTAGTGSLLKLYTGSAPVNADSAVSGTLLVTLTVSGALGTVSNGVITLGAVTSGTAVATGTAGYGRLTKSDGTTTVCDFTSVSTTGADINLNSTSITSGGTVAVTSGTIQEAFP